MPFEWIAAVRFLREGRMQSLLIIVGVGVGVAVIVFMSALLSGLQANLIKRTLSSQAHITLLPPEEIARPQQATDATALRLQKQAQRLRAIDQWQTLRDRLETWPEIAAVSPVASGPAFAVRGEANKAITVVGIEPEGFLRLIDTAEAGGVPKVLISGNSTEPLLYPAISEVISSIKQHGMQLRLYSNFHFGERLVTIADRLAGGDVIRISLDGASASAYDLVHRPCIKNAFHKTMENIEVLLERRKELGAKFEVQIAFLMTRLNSFDARLADLAEWCVENGVDLLRFTVPLRPHVGNASFPSQEQLSMEESLQVKSFLGELKRSYGRGGDIISIMDDDPELPAKQFCGCHHWKLIAMLGATGRFFPCTSMSLVSLMDRLGIGDVNDPAFSFWEFWNKQDKWRNLAARACAGGISGDCTRYEYTVNREIENLMRSRRAGI